MRRRHCLLGAGSTLLTGVLAGFAGAAAARDDDDGEFVILHARYGTEANHADVTGRLRELARRDQSFRLENDVFGMDPDPGRTKTLRIFARDRSGRERTFEYRERDWVNGNQFVGWGGGSWGNAGGSNGWHGNDGRDSGEFTIRYATYGTRQREVDVTDRLRELARRDQRFRLGNDTFGIDPDPGQTKRLRIVTRERGGQERVFEYRENMVVDGAQFIGWGGGNWGGNDNGWGPQRPGGGRLVIDNASYGSGNRRADVSEALRARVRGDRLDAEVSNEWLGIDPAPGARKTLTVTYRRDNGRASTVRVNEGDWIRLP